MITFDEAYSIVIEKLKELTPGVETVGLRESLGRISAEDILSDLELPGFDNSAMDGIAVNFHEDITKWKIKCEISAGHFNNIVLGDNEAALIMTGAAMPSCCDTVIPVEDLSINGNEAYLKNGAAIRQLQNVRVKGQDLKIKDIILQKHTKIEPKHILLLASAGANRINVLRQIKAAIVVTGDELIDIDSELREDKMYSSNLYGIETMMSSSQMECVYSEIAKDNKLEIESKLIEALNLDIDLLITSGGVSMGKYDHVQEVLKGIGAEIIFWKVNIKPGKPMLFAEITRNGKKVFVFGLPGNPVSAFVNFHLFVRNAVLDVIFGTVTDLQKAILKESLNKKDGKRHFVRGILENDGRTGRNTVTPIRNQSSSNMAGLSNANALIILKETVNEITEGELVECIMM